MGQSNRTSLAIWGFGREGRASLAHFLRQEEVRGSVHIIDTRRDLSLGDSKADLQHHTSVHTVPWPEVHTMVKSPGVSFYDPGMTLIRQHGVTCTSATNLWLAGRPPGVVLFVTGTKGKSTTARLLTTLLNAAGHKACHIGNIGEVALNLQEAYQYYVFEASSFQITDLAHTVDFALFLNLYPEHLDWHRSIESYHRDKTRLLTLATQGVICHSSFEGEERGISPSVRSCFYDRATEFSVTLDHVWYQGKRTRMPSSLRASHNVENLRAALSTLQVMGIDIARALEGLFNYSPLPHRQFVLGRQKDVRYVDDSICTNPLAASAALKEFKGPDTVFMMGGYDRGLPLEEFVESLARTPMAGLVAMDETGKRIVEALQKEDGPLPFPWALASSFEEALAQAQAFVPEGGTIILSPAAPSFGWFDNFEHRGKTFASLVGLPYDR